MKQIILNHFGFARLPFGKDIDTKHVFSTQALAQATALIELGLESEDLILLTGPIGCGNPSPFAGPPPNATPIAISSFISAATSAVLPNSLSKFCTACLSSRLIQSSKQSRCISPPSPNSPGSPWS